MVASLHHLLPLLHVFSSTHHMSGVVPSLHHVRAPQPMVLRRVSVCRCACSACSSAKGEGEAGGLSAQRAYRVSCVCRVSSCLCHRMPFSSYLRASVSLVLPPNPPPKPYSHLSGPVRYCLRVIMFLCAWRLPSFGSRPRA